MTATVSSRVTVPLTMLNEEDLTLAQQSLRVTNPEYIAFTRFSRGFGTAPPKHLVSYTIHKNEIIVPRAWFYTYWPHLATKVVTAQPAAKIPEPKLDPLDHQRAAIHSVMEQIEENDQEGRPTDGYIVIPPSGGKTIAGMMLASCVGLRTLVVVPTKEIEMGWKRDLQKCLGIKPSDVGTIRAQKCEIKNITIGSIQTLMDLPESLWGDKFGLLLVDEVHRIPGVRFQEVVRRCAAHIRIGLTATDYRKDGSFTVVKFHLGEHYYKNEEYLNSVPLVYHPVVTPYGLSKRLSEKRTEEYTFNDLLESLQTNRSRTDMIVALTQKIRAEYPGSVLIVSPRVDHIEDIALSLRNAGIDPAVITGTSPDREKTFEKIVKGDYPVTVATTKIMAEGASVPKWHHVINTMPFSDTKLAVQLGGRPIRMDTNKTEGHFWDLVDTNPMARNMAIKRMHALKKNTKAIHTHDMFFDPKNGYLFPLRRK